MNNKLLFIRTTLFPARHSPFNMRGLIDSGCSGRAFISKKLVETYQLPTQPTPYRRTLLLADGKTADTITEYAILPVIIGNHDEHCLFFVTNLADDTPVIFGLPWLKRHNPYIDWAAMSLTFNSWYCRRYCCPSDTRIPLEAPTIPDPPRAFHDLPIPHEPVTTPLSPAAGPPSPYRSPYYENAPDEEDEDTKRNSKLAPLHAETLLEPTYLQTMSNPTPKYRVPMVPSQPKVKPVPARIVAGVRQKGSPPTRPSQQNAPNPRLLPTLQKESERPDLSDIRMAMATNFLQFCRDPNVRVAKVTWNELDNPTDTEHTIKTSTYAVPDLPDAVFQDILHGKEDVTRLRSLFPEEFHTFLDDCCMPVRLRGISEDDIEKFIQDKSDLQKENLLKFFPQ